MAEIKITVKVRVAWIWDDKKFKAGDTVTMTKAQYEYFTNKMPNVFEKISEKPGE